MGKERPKVTPKKRRLYGRRRKKPRSNAGEWKDVFLATVRVLPVVRVACEKAGITRKTAYQWRKGDAEFAKEWDEAREDGIDRIEQNLINQALNQNTTAAIFLLKSLRRNVYAERLEPKGPGGEAIPPVRFVLPHNNRNPLPPGRKAIEE